MKMAISRWLWLAALLSTGVGHKVVAGTCSGAGESTVLYLEYLLHNLDAQLLRLAETSYFAVANGRRISIDAAGQLVVWQAHRLLLEGLKQAEGKPQDRFSALVRDLERLATQSPYLSQTEEWGPPQQDILRRAVMQVAKPYAYCRAMAVRDTSLCQMIEFSPEEAGVCRRMVLRWEFYRPGKCDPEKIAAMAEAMGSTENLIELACEIKATRALDRCGELGDMRTLCRAFLTDDEKECRSGDDGRMTNRCLGALREYRLVNRGKGETPEDDDELSKAGWIGLVQPESCPRLALETWEKFIGYPFNLSAAAVQ